MRLLECEDLSFYRGTVFRFKGEYPFCEEYVDFMLCVYPSVDDNHCPLALYCVSGYEAGHIEYVFPTEAQFENNPNCISKEWLIENWNKRIYDKCKADEIEVII